LISGAVFGFLSGTPFVGALNCICCSLCVGAGVLASFLVVRASELPVTYGRAALSGLLSGLFAAAFSVLSSVLFMVVRGVTFQNQIDEAVEKASQISPSAQQASEVLVGLGAPVIILLMLLFEVCFYAPFGALGGVIGRAIFEKRSAAPPSPQTPAADPTIQP